MGWKWLLITALLFVGLTSATPKVSLQWDEDVDRSLRVVEAPTTPNRIADVMINILVDFFARRGWNLRKTLRTVSGSVPFNTDNGQRAMQVEISNGVYKNLGSMRRAKSATIDTAKHLMRGSFSFDGLEFRGNYKISTPAVAQAPASTAKGTVSSTAFKYFVDYTFLVDSQGLPIGIQSWEPRAGQIQYNGATNLGGNKYQEIFNSVLKDSTKSLLERLITNDLFNIVNNQIVNKMVVQE